MTKRPNISVVIPTLNEEENLQNCLRNLCPQLLPGDDVIVIDGGSDDRTTEVAQKYGCTTMVARGSTIGKARHLGTKESENEVIASTDADAIPPEGWVERVRQRFEEDNDLVVLWGNIEDKNGVPVRNLVGKFSTFFGGASGNNTAFRRKAYEKLEEGYSDINFMEDTEIIKKLSRLGVSKRDKGLVMQMNMDRRRYQTIPILAASGLMAATGFRTIGPERDFALGMGAGLAGTELTYENFTGTSFHHDQVGSALLGVSKYTGSKTLKGAGIGLIMHHVATEGLSVLPTVLQRNTDKILE